MDVYLSPSKAGYCVLNHGDFHGKNLLFRNVGVVQEDFYLIDYQFPTWSTPALDIYGLLNNIANADARENQRDEIIKLYYNEFTGTLKKLSYREKIPSLVDLRVELIRFSIVDLIHTIASSPMQFIRMDQIDYNEFIEDSGKAMAKLSQMVYDSEEYRAYLTRTLTRLRNQGTLEVN